MTPHNPVHIDLVAAHLTSAQAPDVRDAVLARLASRPRVRWTWFVMPLTAGAAALAIAIGTRPSTVPPTIATLPTQALVTPVTTRPDTAPIGVGSVADQPAPRTARRSLGNETATIEWRARAVPALDVMASISVDAIQPEALSIAQLEVKPLVMPPIDGGGAR